MTKWKDRTKGGCRILWREEITEGERKGWSCGVVEAGNIFHSAIWDEDGMEFENSTFNLVPAEPEVVYTGWLSVYTNSTSALFTAQTYAILGGVLGFIRIDWLDDGTFTVTKEEYE